MGHGPVLAVLHPAQVFVFNWRVDRVGLQGTIRASNARLHPAGDDSGYINTGLSVVRRLS